ncbi:MAG: hypothetical protein A2579_06005 [Lysobacterales bacterium RIFOXYD1_FULL_69_11]|nr:MAG: hypothetical protein A2190_12105 [Xanthomonadales bacterium RIFOXYA1_FULL_69_10]OHE87454.1 MAG: hypothetical protein A2579_06005 [Xanthomonadales bacterium RIFOXYD1_FULL_69_11]
MLAACSDPAGPADETAPSTDAARVDEPADPSSPEAVTGPGTTEMPGATDPAAGEGPTRGGDGSQITLQPLTPGQLEDVELPGELACSFADDTGATLLLARADVTPDGMVRGAVNNNGYVEAMGNGRAGGFNDLVDGITLSGKGMTVVLARGAAQPTGNESTQHVATLTVQRADGAERTYDGLLTCGP